MRVRDAMKARLVLSKVDFVISVPLPPNGGRMPGRADRLYRSYRYLEPRSREKVAQKGKGNRLSAWAGMMLIRKRLRGDSSGAVIPEGWFHCARILSTANSRFLTGLSARFGMTKSIFAMTRCLLLTLTRYPFRLVASRHVFLRYHSHRPPYGRVNVKEAA